MPRRVERIGETDRDIKQRSQFDRCGPDPLFQGFALEQLHRDELPAFVLTDVVNGADMRMIQRRRGACFAEEALHGRAITAYLFGKELQRDMSTETHILGFVHHAHTARTNHGHNRVRSKPRIRL